MSAPTSPTSTRRPEMPGDDSAEFDFTDAVAVLWHRRRLVGAGTAVVAVLTVVISLLLQNRYEASTRLLLPEGGSGGTLAAALGDNLPAAARALFSNNASSGYLRYLSILSSRTVLDTVVDHFDLETVYDIDDGPTSTDDAREVLRDHLKLIVDTEYEFLQVNVIDRDPARAADMANFVVQELQRVNADLASQNAANFRFYVEQRYQQVENDLNAVLGELTAFREKHGILNLTTQAETFFESVAAMRSVVFEAEIQHARLRAELGEASTAARAASQALDTAQRAYGAALGGQERILPVPQDSLPSVGRQYFDLEQDRVVLSTILEYMRPILEDARFDEQRQIEAVQVIDPAVPPSRKAYPRRAVICVVGTMSAFMLLVVFVLALEWWQRNHRRIAHRLRDADIARRSPARGPTDTSNDR